MAGETPSSLKVNQKAHCLNLSSVRGSQIRDIDMAHTLIVMSRIGVNHPRLDDEKGAK